MPGRGAGDQFCAEDQDQVGQGVFVYVLVHIHFTYALKPHGLGIEM